MNIYLRKKNWKIGLGIGAFIIIFLSIVYTNYLVREIAQEEKRKIRIWTEAIEKRASLVKRTNLLFEKIKSEERKRVEIWAGASKLLTISEGSADLNFYLEILNGNTTIPVILTDQKKQIISWKNIPGVNTESTAQLSNKERRVLNENLQLMIVNKDSIMIPLQGINYNIIYFRQSIVFDELKNILDVQLRNFITEVVKNGPSVPVIVTNESRDRIIASGNIDTLALSGKLALSKTLRSMESENTPVVADLGTGERELVFYRDTALLTTLKYFPVVQFGLIALFLYIAYSLFSTSRKAEQHQVWVGMARETAHQLGTPLSSLVAWNELRKISSIPPDFEEVEKDIKRLETIANRFSKIGSQPELNIQNLSSIVESICNYMRTRISQRIQINTKIDQGILIECNETLVEWVIENLIRNAADSMEKPGIINITLEQQDEYAVLDVADNGKGIPRKDHKNIFRPGFTTKKRGWGLGLTLAKRIVEEYHDGKIFVKESVPGEGTVIRILLSR